jgi:hypothetical protein
MRVYAYLSQVPKGVTICIQNGLSGIRQDRMDTRPMEVVISPAW